MTIRTDRPRLLLAPAIVADLKARAVPTNDRWTGLQSLCDRSPASWDVGIMNYCLAYVVTGNTAYVTKAWALMEESMKAGTAQASNPGHKPTMGPPTFMKPTGVHEVDGDSGYQCRNYFLASCLLFDWCYPALNPGQKAQLRADIEACGSWVYPRTNPSRAGQWGVDAPGNNYHAGFQCTWYAGLALSGDSSLAQGYLDEALRRWNTMVLPYCNGPAKGGAMYEGTSYSVDTLGMTLMQLLAHTTATDTDLLTPQLNGGWCGDAIRWLTHMTAPTLDRLAPLGDQTKSSSGALQDSARAPMLIAASRGFPGAQLWLDQTIPNRCQGRVNAWLEYLLYPGALPSPAQPAAPSTFYSAAGSGLVSSRSGWDKDATQIVFWCGPVFESHQDRACGELMIFRGDWLAAQAKLRTNSGLSQDPIDHNVVTFGATKSSWTQDTAKLIIQENTDAYTYLVGDLTGAYAPGGVPTVGHYTRTIFFLKPNFVLIRDEFTLLNLGNTPVFHLHTLDQPSVGITGFDVASKAAGTRLSGTAAVMCQAAIPIKATVDQVPTWRMDFPADTTGGFCVALEAAPASVGSRQVGMFVPPSLRGAMLGNDMAAVVTGDLPVTYKSPVTGTHYLLGLKPSIAYKVNDDSFTSTAAGVLTFKIGAIGAAVMISEGNITPPPVLTVTGYYANPAQAETELRIYGTGFTASTTATYAGQSLPITYREAGMLITRAPGVMNSITALVIVTSGGRSTAGPPLTVYPAPIPPPVGRKFELLIAPDGTPAIGKEITS